MPQLVRRRAFGAADPAVAGHRQAFRERLTGADGSEFEPAHSPVRS